MRGTVLWTRHHWCRCNGRPHINSRCVSHRGSSVGPSGFSNVAPPMGDEKAVKLAAPSSSAHLSRERAKLRRGDTHAAEQDPAPP